ncbi:MAG: 3-dehydroquinate synthase [Candidatus Margulisiibacteriota bacterium]
MKKLRLALKHCTSEIVIGQEILPKLGKYLAEAKLPRRVVVICDTTVSRIYGAVIKHSLRSSGFKSDIIAIPSGEKVKSLELAKKLYKKFLDIKVHRDSTVIALGGGVVGDLSGFVAATYMRGIDFVQVPTTLLAQVDASIGGKTAVNLEEAKNIVGAFYQPKLVFADVAALITLPPSEIRNGLAEVIKYGIIKDAALFSFVEKQMLGIKNPRLTNPKEFKDLLGVWEQIVSRSAGIKIGVVASDEKETKGPRMLLNFGHTIGHAIEALNDYKGITHGQAVAVGMLAASRISLKLKLCREDVVKRLEALLSSVGLPTEIKGLESEDIIAKLILDKKVRDGKILFVLPRTVGSVVIRNDIPIKVVREVLKQIGTK